MPNTESTLSSMDSERFPTGPIIISAATRFIGTLSCNKSRKGVYDKATSEALHIDIASTFSIAVARKPRSRIFASFVNSRTLVGNLENG